MEYTEGMTIGKGKEPNHIEISDAIKNYEPVIERLGCLLAKIKGQDAGHPENEPPIADPCLSEFLKSSANIIQGCHQRIYELIDQIENELF